MLSRHQRNPDELDLSSNSTNVPIDPLRLSTENSYGSRLRHRNTPNRPTASGFAADQDDDNSDPEDNKPLQMIANESPNRTVRSSTRNSTPATSLAPTSARNARTQKRPYYNEDSDESVNTNQTSSTTRNTYHPSKRRLVEEDEADDDDHSYTPNRRGNSTATAASTTSIATTSHTNGRNATRQRHNYGELSNSEDDLDSEDAEQCQISVSSRGRVRRISSKVRGYFREN